MRVDPIKLQTGSKLPFAEISLRSLAAFLLVAVIGGCNRPLPVLHSGPDPSDDKSIIVPMAYNSVTAGTANYQPVEPKSWREMNERVTPPSRQSP